MTDKLRELLEDVQTVYEGKGMIVHPNSFDRLRMEVLKLDNVNKQQSEQVEKMKCCENCKHHCFWGNELNCRTLSYDEELECMKTKNKWELVD